MKEWIQKYLSKIQHHKSTLAGAAILALLPLCYVLIWCLLNGKWITDIYLPGSAWNDELFYYKLTEGVVHFGYPQGYFGFNESHGLYLSFAAWSPLLLLAWSIWGILFGWNLLSPVFCNIALLGISFFFFGIWARPDKKQIIAIGALCGAFLPLTRFTMSCIPETEIFALFILFIGLTISCRRSYQGPKIAGLFALAMLMTWMRPYLLLLFFTPYLLWRKKHSLRATGVSGLLLVLTLGIYYGVNHCFSAPYLTDLYYTQWIETYFTKGPLEGIKFTLWKLKESLTTVGRLISDNLFSAGEQDSAAGCYYLIFLLLFVTVAIRFWVSFKRKKNTWDWQMLLCMLGFFVADLLMYRIQEGGRHTLVYIVGCLLLIPLWEENRHQILSGVLVLLFLIVFWGCAEVPYEFGVPYRSPEKVQQLEQLEQQLENGMELAKVAPSYENTVIWTLWDGKQGETQVVDFGAYYSIPKGFGINLCDGGYMNANLEQLRSRYVGVLPGGDLEKRCKQAGGKQIGACEQLVIYDMRP